MRTQINLSEMPPAFTVEKENDQAIITFYTDVQEVPSAGENQQSPSYSATAWTITRSWTSGISERVEANPDAWLKLAKDEAYEAAAAEVRAARNQMLANSDNDMALDRLHLPEPPTGTSMTAWRDFLVALSNAVHGAWAIYRQNLRDIPDQPGFPFNVEWPDTPDSQVE